MRVRAFSAIRAAVAGLLLAGNAIHVVPAAAQAVAPAAGPGQPAVAGNWLDHQGKAAVEVQPCGSELCGAIVWLKDPLDPKGKPWRDMLNPDARLRARQVCGLQIIGGLKPDKNGAWTGGWVYDPEEGKSFNVEISLKDANTLTVFGFAGIRLLSETMIWKRLPANQPRCKG